MSPSPSHAGLVGQLLNVFLYVGSEWVMYLLIALSVISIGIALERALFYRQHRIDLARVQDALLELLNKGDLAKARAFLQGERALAAKVTIAGLDHLSGGTDSAAEYMSAVLLKERAAYERGLAYLGTLGNNAPFVGLFGTVLGIIRSFRDLASNTQQGASAVMGGIAEALVATAVGLLVALPAVAIFNTYQRYVKNTVTGAGALSHLVLAYGKRREEAEVDGKRPSIVRS